MLINNYFFFATSILMNQFELFLRTPKKFQKVILISSTIKINKLNKLNKQKRITHSTVRVSPAPVGARIW